MMVDPLLIQAAVIGTLIALVATTVGALVNGYSTRRALAAQQKHDRVEKRRAQLQTACADLLAVTGSLFSKRHAVELQKPGTEQYDEATRLYFAASHAVTEKQQLVLLLGSPQIVAAAERLVDELNPTLRAFGDRLKVDQPGPYAEALRKYQTARNEFFAVVRRELGVESDWK